MHTLRQNMQQLSCMFSIYLALIIHLLGYLPTSQIWRVERALLHNYCVGEQNNKRMSVCKIFTKQQDNCCIFCLKACIRINFKNYSTQLPRELLSQPGTIMDWGCYGCHSFPAWFDLSVSAYVMMRFTLDMTCWGPYICSNAVSIQRNLSDVPPILVHRSVMHTQKWYQCKSQCLKW